MNFIKITLAICSLLFLNQLQSQVKPFIPAKDTTAIKNFSHQVTSRSAKDQIILRWAPTSYLYWSMANQYGYNIERIEVNIDPTKNNDALTEEQLTFKPLTKSPIKPWSKEEFGNKIDTTNKYLLVAAQMLYGAPESQGNVTKGGTFANTLDEQSNKHAYALMAADFDVETANALGMMYVDKDVKPGMFYYYRVTINHSEPDYPTDTIDIYIDFSKKYVPQAVTNCWIESYDKHIEVAWTFSNSAKFSAYDIERSTDQKKWTRLNERPYVSSQGYLEKSFQYFDSTAIKSNTYYYRLRGYTPFGDMGAYSESMSAATKDLTAPAPVFDLKAKDQKGAIIVTWDALPNEADHDGFYVGRSANAAGGFVKISKKLAKTERSFADLKADPLENNYYVVYSVDKNGNESESYAAYGSVVDNLPPTLPTGLKGTIDTTGFVRLEWNRGPEADIIGYRVYWANDSTSEFSQLTGDILSHTVYFDSVNVKTLSEYSYYKITAVDHKYNHSEYSKILQLHKPDLVPPVTPVINKYEQGQKEVKFSWVNSTSADVKSHRLERKYKDEEFKEVAVFTKNEKEYTDKNLTANQSYSYRLIAIDDAGNRSISKALIITAIDRGIREEIESLKLTNKDGNSSLEWKYNTAGNYVFVIYRQSKDKSGFEPFARVENTQKTFKVNDPNTVYGIRAVFSDGGESKMALTSK